MTPTEIRHIVDRVVAASPGWTVRQSEAETGSLLVTAPGASTYSVGVTHAGVVWVPFGGSREMAATLRTALAQPIRAYTAERVSFASGESLEIAWGDIYPPDSDCGLRAHAYLWMRPIVGGKLGEWMRAESQPIQRAAELAALAGSVGEAMEALR